LAGWLRVLGRIKLRKASSNTYQVERKHFEGLPLSYIRHCDSQTVLQEAVAAVKLYRPPRGDRAGHFTTSILVELNNQINRLTQETEDSGD
jgi:hypothetical protein